MEEAKLIPSKKLYYILSSIGLGVSIVSISLLLSLNIVWLNIGLSILCIIYTVIFVSIYLKKESKEKTKLWGDTRVDNFNYCDYFYRYSNFYRKC